MEIQKTSNSQSNLEKEEWNWSDSVLFGGICTTISILLYKER